MSKVSILFDVFIAKIAHVVKLGAAALVTRVLGAFGLTLITFNGLLPNLKSFINQFIAQLPPAALNFMGAIGLDVAISMVLSAYAVRMAFKVFIVPKTVADSIGGAL
jgi:hypothetical protein